MVKLERDKRRFAPLQRIPLSERLTPQELRDFIFNAPAEFFSEAGQKLFLAGREVRPSASFPGEADLLALDSKGRAVVILLDHGEGDLLARAITLAGLIASWPPERFLQALSGQQREDLQSFLEPGCEQINAGQRTVLIGESFRFELLAAARWLWEKNQMDCAFLQVFFCHDPESGAEYLSCVDLSGEAARLGIGFPWEDGRAPAASATARPVVGARALIDPAENGAAAPEKSVRGGSEANPQC